MNNNFDGLIFIWQVPYHQLGMARIVYLKSETNQVDIYLMNPKYVSYFHLGVWQWHPGIMDGIEKLPVFQTNVIDAKIRFTQYDDQTREANCIRAGEKLVEGNF